MTSAATTGPTLEVALHTGPFHVALRAAVRGRGLTLDRLRAHLARRGIRIAVSTLSDWQHGKRRPAPGMSLDAVRGLEEVLRLPDGALVRLLGDAARPARSRRGVDERSGALAGLLDQVPGARNDLSDVVSDHEKVVINADRRLDTMWCRTVVRARRPGVDRYVIRYFGDPGCDVDRIDLWAMDNCRVGRVVRDPAGVLVAEMLFDEALDTGETWVFEMTITDPTGQPTTEHAHGFRAPDQQHLMEIRFDPSALPVDCHSFAQSDLYDLRYRTGDLTLSRHHAMHLLTCGAAGGLVGVAWSWPR